MATYTYRIDGFYGIDQSRDENSLPTGCSPDAMNMDTEGGNLAVANGYTRLFPAPVPGRNRIDRLLLYKSAVGLKPIAISGGKVYALNTSGSVWTSVYDYGSVSQNRRYDAVTAKIGDTDYIIIADGEHQLIKYDGNAVELFGSEEDCSNIAVNYLAMYRNRLFAAGDSTNPNRLYYSQLPGGDRNIEKWGYVEASPAVEGGHAEVGATGGDPITAITALSNQLLIFKKNSLYRLIGDRPSNFTIERVEAAISPVAHTAIATYGDVVYFVTKDGLHYFNGVDAAPMPDMRLIKRIMASADASDCRAAVSQDTLYFTIAVDGESRLIKYDLFDRRYMQHGGFDISDLITYEGELALINSKRYIYKWGEGSSYDGAPISAYWKTPLTDLHDKSAIKSMRELYLRGNTDAEGNALLTDITIGRCRDTYRFLLPDGDWETLEIPLMNEGRTFQIKFYNEAGGRFAIIGGTELVMNIRKRTE